jgi:mono/diheme cytochrome c family protein
MAFFRKLCNRALCPCSLLLPVEFCSCALCENERTVTQLRLFLPALLLVCLASPVLAASSDTKADEESGAALFRDSGCTYCHGADLKGTKKAPALEEIRKDKAWTPEKMSNQILNGGQKMPPFRDSLSDDQIADLVAFLRAKKRPPLPPADASTPGVAPQ